VRITVNRRRAKRRALPVWAARYRLGASEPWYDCRLLDISEVGVGLELLGPLPPTGVPLILELEQPCLALNEEKQSPLEDFGLATLELDTRQSIGAELQAVVRRSVKTAEGFRVGAEFTTLSPLERSVLTLLIERETFLASM